MQINNIHNFKSESITCAAFLPGAIDTHGPGLDDSSKFILMVPYQQIF